MIGIVVFEGPTGQHFGVINHVVIGHDTAGDQAQDRADESHPRGFEDNHPANLSLGCADGAQHADLSRAIQNRGQQRVDDAKNRDDYGNNFDCIVTTNDCSMIRTTDSLSWRWVLMNSSYCAP